MARITGGGIIKAAFKVWGKELYEDMSLSGVARELGVCKAALYRHFSDKQVLLDAMNDHFFDEHAAFIRKDYERALALEDLKESCLIMIRSTSEYYGRNKDAFVFSLFQIFGSGQVGKYAAQMVSRGVDFDKFLHKINDTGRVYEELPLFQFAAHLIMVSVIFWIAQFHHFDNKAKENPADEEIRLFIASVEDRIKLGLGLSAEKAGSLDYARLEEIAAATLPSDTEDDRLLRAVAGAVAEAGPSHASMEMVARRSGLAKSSLYSHFRNKQDMLDSLFLSEFNRIAAYARANIKTSKIPEEQLYLGLASIAAYLQSRPDILAVMDWLRTRRPKLRPRMKPETERMLPEIYRIITDIGLDSLGKEGEEKDRAAQWILFLTVKSLVWRRETNALLNSGGFNGTVLPENMRMLFRFIARGLEGFNL